MYKVIRKDTNENVTKRSAITSDGSILLKDANGAYYLADPSEYEVYEYPIPTKENFRKIMEAIEDINNKNDELNEVLQKICTDSILYFPTLEATLLDYLSEVFNDQYDYIYFFTCELYFGKKWEPNKYFINDHDYELTSPDDLYDLLIRNLSK